MANKLKGLISGLIIYITIQILALGCCFILKPEFLIFLSLAFLLLNVVLAIFVFINYQKDLRQRVVSITEVLGSEGQKALEIGHLGIMTYDDNYVITWISELFDEYSKELIGQKVTKISSDLRYLFNGEATELKLEFKERNYRIISKETAQVLFWQDITEITDLNKRFQDNKLVIGMIHLDNYNDTVQNEDEQVTALINANIRQPVVDWAKERNIFIRRLRSDRFILILNERKYLELEEEQFSILDFIRLEAQKINIDISLSMVFARGSNDFSVMDEMINNLLELALSRGGDQVVMRIYQKEVKYFGGTSEAVEKSSKVKARVMAKTIRELINKAPQVFIVGHEIIDFDCMGAMLAMSRIAQRDCNEVYVVSEGMTCDKQLDEALTKFLPTISDSHQFVSEEEALVLVGTKALVICIDHHHLGLCGAPELVNQAKNLIVIDHHRRGESFFLRPTLVYVEPSASSSSELLAELLAYHPQEIELEPFESTLMLTGIIVDTNHFRIRSGTRTFEAAAFIKTKGADLQEAESFLKDSFDDFENKNKIFSYSRIINDNLLIAAVKKEDTFKRGIIAQAANELLDVQNIEAVFVIAKTENNSCVISARSKGRINVQMIMEKMDGGGHFSAAGVQRENGSVALLESELLEILKEDKNESNTIN